MFVQMLGGTWLERNIGALIAHVLDLVTNPKAASSHVEAVYSRKCVNFILRGTIGKLLGEGAQAAACKEIAHIILKQMNSIGKNNGSIFSIYYLCSRLISVVLTRFQSRKCQRLQSGDIIQPAFISVCPTRNG